MYLTAQKVVSQDEKEGINAFFHLHRTVKLPKPLSKLDVISVAESNTGELVEDKCDINPGGNRVKSYLDIVASDTIDEKSINEALDAFRKKISQDKMGPIVDIVGVIGLRFGAEIKLYQTLTREYLALRKKAMSLFRTVRSH
jgi:hypothetical protein